MGDVIEIINAIKKRFGSFHIINVFIDNSKAEIQLRGVDIELIGVFIRMNLMKDYGLIELHKNKIIIDTAAEKKNVFNHK